MVFCPADGAENGVAGGGELRQRFGAENSDPNMMAEAAQPKSKIPGLKEKPSFGEGESGKLLDSSKSRKRQRAN